MAWKLSGLLTATLLFAACATIPSGPSVLVLPGTGKPFEQFQADDGVCRGWANQQVGGATPGTASQSSTAASATLGTLAGAAAGAAIGAAAGSAGAGAAIGAGSGLLLGTATGASAGSYSAGEVQRRYDHAYIQCMYAKGNRVPIGGGLTSQPAAPPPPPPPPPQAPPPPPPPPPPPK